MKVRTLKSIATPYDGILSADYEIEKQRLQLELLKIQQKFIDKQQRLVVIFEDEMLLTKIQRSNALLKN